MTDTRINDEVVASRPGWIVQITNRGGQVFGLCTQSPGSLYFSTSSICNYPPVMGLVNDKRLNCNDLPSIGI
jgi:hypothetical protein